MSKRVYLERLRIALPIFVRASSLHVGAAATAASLRGELVQRKNLVSGDDFSRCFAVARLTPGTNLLALYGALGYQIASWQGAGVAIGVGAVVPTIIITLVAMVYSDYGTIPLISRFMSGAKAGALAVLVWGVGRLAWPVLERHHWPAAAIAIGALALAWSGALSPLIILTLAGILGAFLLNTR